MLDWEMPLSVLCRPKFVTPVGCGSRLVRDARSQDVGRFRWVTIRFPIRIDAFVYRSLEHAVDPVLLMRKCTEYWDRWRVAVTVPLPPGSTMPI